MELEYHNYRITTDAYNYIVAKNIFSEKANEYVFQSSSNRYFNTLAQAVQYMAKDTLKDKKDITDINNLATEVSNIDTEFENLYNHIKEEEND